MPKKFLIFLLLAFCTTTLADGAHPFLFGLKIQDNNADIALAIENTFNIRIPVVGLFYDDFSDKEYASFTDAVEKLGKNRVYHLTVNPLGYTAKELLIDPDFHGYKAKYLKLFKYIKDNNLKVIFRFCHEMNGGWYSWASDPIYYPILWKTVWDWSRDVGLDQKNILFDYSVNSQDLPRVGSEKPTQESIVIPCNQIRRAGDTCYTFEDYYPGDKYVDVMGITAYNWGLGARSEKWAYWRPFATTVDEPGYNTFSRLKHFGKPLYIDEAGSTSIFYTGAYDPQKARDLYDLYHTGTPENPATGNPLKNEWIEKYHNFLKSEPVIGGSYFNVDITYGLRDRSQIGELDWTIADPQKHFIYPVVNSILSDPDLVKNPEVLFDMEAGSGGIIPENRFDSFVTTIRRTIGFPLGDQIFTMPYQWGNKQVKYQRHVEQELEKTPALCQEIKQYFGELTCQTESNAFLQAFAHKLFTLLLNHDLTKDQKQVLYSKLEKISDRFEEETTKKGFLAYISYLSDYAN